MKLELRPFKAEDIYKIEKREQTSGINECVSPERAVLLEQMPFSRTVTGEDGKIWGVGGVIEAWPGRAECWAVLAPGSRPHMPAITEFVRQVLDEAASKINRIEVAVRCGFSAGHEWAHTLGFIAEAECLRAYDADGYDCSIYARVSKTKEVS